MYGSFCHSPVSFRRKLTNNIKMNHKFGTLLFGFALVLTSQSSQAAIVVTYAETPGTTTTTISGTQEFAFSSAASTGSIYSPGLTVGKQNNLSWPGVGTIDTVYMQNADQYGAATGTRVYPVQSSSVGSPNNTPTTTLSLNTQNAYFGIWWSAGDANNQLQFFNGTSLVATFTTASLLSALPSTYKGNPTTQFKGQDSSEDFAFINFYGSSGTTWNSVKFSNVASTGFESDNWTTRTNAWGTGPGETPGAYPGIALETIPEANTTIMGAAMVLGVFAHVGRKNLRSGLRQTLRFLKV